VVADAGIPLDGIERVQASGRALALRLSATVDALPETTTGWDSRKAVRVDIDRMAQLTAITVADRWTSAVSPAELASAVLEAKAAADELYSAALEAAVPREDAGLDADSTAGADLLARAESYGGTRGTLDLAEDVLASVPRDASEPAPAAGDDWVVTTPTPYALTIEAGILTGVRIDAGWASSRSAATINHALASAIDDARSSAAEGSADPAPTGDDLVELLASLVNMANGFGTAPGRN
jgi:hypothetical protein